MRHQVTLTCDRRAVTITDMHVCRVCGAEAIELPEDQATPLVTCSACQREQRVRDYVSDAERLRSVVGDVVAARHECQERLVTGVTCTTCGGTTALPRDRSLKDFKCSYCGVPMLVSDHVDPPIPAGANLGAGMDASYSEHAPGRRRQITIVLTSVVVGVVVALLFTWLFE